jgi:hypothetical protein
MSDKSKLFGNLSNDGLEKTGDSLGGGGILDSGVYKSKIKVAYATTAKSGARAVNFQFETEDGRQYSETMYVTNKQGENFYTKNDKKYPLPGFTTVNELCLCATGLGLADQDFDEKIVKIYDFESKAEVPTKVPVLSDLTGKEVTLGILRETVDKQKKDDNDQYVNTGETRDQNTIDKVFHSETERTVSEIVAKLETPVFMGEWSKKHSGKTRNKAKGVEGKAGLPAAANSSNGGQAPKKSLFG